MTGGEESAEDLMTIGRVSRLTGMSVSTIRAWESRYGFPRPVRLAGGHRRYTGEEFRLLRRVAVEAQHGTSLPRAIARVLEAEHGTPSVFAAVKSALPGSEPQRIPKGSMVQISRALEDEIAWRTQGGVLVGGFQHRRFFELERRRWEQMAASASVALVLGEGLVRQADAAPVRVPLEPGDLLRREWFLFAADTRFAAGLVGWEAPRSPATSATGGRRFELIWTLEPRAVLAALETVAAVVDRHDPVLAAELRGALESAAPPPVELDVLTSVSKRIIDYLASAAG